MQINNAFSSGLYSYSASPSKAAQAASNGNDSAREAPTPSDTSTVALSFEGLMAAKNEQETATASSTGSADGWNWTTSSAGISHATSPDGREWRKVELDRVLTPEDKKLVGWPSTHDPAAQQAALFIAMDRADGYLKGAVTQEYLEGNANKHIPGLAERSPAISQSIVSEMLKRLG